MELKGFKFITGKVVPRPWGTEFRFTASDSTKEYNEVIDIQKEDDEKTIALMVQARLDLVSVPVEVVEEKIDPVLVEKYLKDNFYLSADQSLADLKTVDDVVDIGGK